MTENTDTDDVGVKREYCPSCGGRGNVIEMDEQLGLRKVSCAYCGGDGRVTKTQRWKWIKLTGESMTDDQHSRDT